MPQDGPWTERVVFDGGTAFVPGRVIVRSGQETRAAALLARTGLRPPNEGDGPPPPSSKADDRRRWRRSRQEPGADDDGPPWRPVAGDFSRLDDVLDPIAAVRLLLLEGLDAQPDHVLFADCCCSCRPGCPPHPASVEANPYGANPYGANPYGANPYGANPYGANPYGANPYGANAGGGCGCGGVGADPYGANPYGANPYGANPYGANPYGANSRRGDRSGRRRSSARPAPAAPLPRSPATASHAVVVAILDTGWPAGHDVDWVTTVPGDAPDRPDGDEDGYLDPVAGHGVFIGGIVRRLAPDAQLLAKRVLGGYGDGAESEIADALLALATPERPDQPLPHIVNLSLGAYSPFRLLALQHAINELLDRGVIVVASAGNDATCRPSYPAALPGVLGVGALTGAPGHRRPAPFTNYGPWVSASAPGVDVVSSFFTYDGAERPGPEGRDPDRFHGWARWSGTSFAAPYVVGRLASHLAGRQEEPPTDRDGALEALEHVVDPGDPDRRVPLLGIRVD